MLNTCTDVHLSPARFSTSAYEATTLNTSAIYYRDTQECRPLRFCSNGATDVTGVLKGTTEIDQCLGFM